MVEIATALGIANNVTAAAKDVWAVGKFIYQKVESAVNHKKMREKLSQDFYIEWLKLSSFKTWFEKSEGMITSDVDLDTSWLLGLQIIFSRISEAFGEYRTLAIQEDPEYQKMLKIDRDNSGWGLFKGQTRSKKTGSSFILSTKWALFEEERFQRLVESFSLQIRHLQDILPHAMYALLRQDSYLLQKSSTTFLKFSADNEDADRLGISRHAHLRGLSAGKAIFPEPDLQIKNAELEVEEAVSSGSLLVGGLRELDGKGRPCNEQTVLVEYKEYPPLRQDESAPNVHPTVVKLAQLLHFSGRDHLGTMPFKGFIDQPMHHCYAFVFEFPSGTSVQQPPHSLHGIILQSSDRPWRLGLRFKIALFLATTLNDLMLDTWTHKNISSHSLVFFRNFDSETLRDGEAYLVNFGETRLQGDTTMRRYDGDAAKDLYRHPQIQHDNRLPVGRVHDIYSLGVVLLEIALWQTAQSIISKAISEPNRRTADNIRKKYMEIAKEEVPHRMGVGYLNAVLACVSPQNDGVWRDNKFPGLMKQVIENLKPDSLKMIL